MKNRAQDDKFEKKVSNHSVGGSAEPSNKNGYLLMVEDEPVVQENNRMILERRGYLIRQAYTLEEARGMIEAEPPRAIILDIQLPDGNGLDLLHEVRSRSDIPILVLTAMGTPKDIIRGLEAGGDDYLTKPHDLPTFIKRVEALLRRAELTTQR